MNGFTFLLFLLDSLYDSLLDCLDYLEIMPTELKSRLRDLYCCGCNVRGDKFRRGNFNKVTPEFAQRFNQANNFNLQLEVDQYLCFKCRKKFNEINKINSNPTLDTHQLHVSPGSSSSMSSHQTLPNSDGVHEPIHTGLSHTVPVGSSSSRPPGSRQSSKPTSCNRGGVNVQNSKQTNLFNIVPLATSSPLTIRSSQPPKLVSCDLGGVNIQESNQTDTNLLGPFSPVPRRSRRRRKPISRNSRAEESSQLDESFSSQSSSTSDPTFHCLLSGKSNKPNSRQNNCNFLFCRYL